MNHTLNLLSSLDLFLEVYNIFYELWLELHYLNILTEFSYLLSNFVKRRWILQIITRECASDSTVACLIAFGCLPPFFFSCWLFGRLFRRLVDLWLIWLTRSSLVCFFSLTLIRLSQTANKVIQIQTTSCTCFCPEEKSNETRFYK